MFPALAAGLGSAASALGQSGAASFLGGVANSWLSGMMSNYWGRKSSRDNAALGYEYSKRLADYNRAQDFAYAQKYNDLNYDLAARYSMNAAKWTVNGLRSAGLNPILAANSGGVGSAQMGTPTPSVGGGGSTISPNGNYPRVDIAEASRDLASLPLQAATAGQVASQTEKTQAETRLQDLSTAREAYNLLQSILNEGERGGIGHFFKAAKLLDPTDDRTRKAAARITENVGRVLEKSLERSLGVPSSASDSTAHDNTAALPAVLNKVGTAIQNSASDVPRPRSNPSKYGWPNRVRRSSRPSRRDVWAPHSYLIPSM